LLDNDLPLAVDVLGDIITSSVLEPADVETERGVILEEIAMKRRRARRGGPRPVAATVFGNHPLGRPCPARWTRCPR